MKKGTYVDVTGQTFGKLTAKQFITIDKGRGAKWLFECTCGNNKYIANIGHVKQQLKDGYTVGCGCEQGVGHPSSKKGTYVDVTGQTFGKLIARRFININSGAIWEFDCSCGTIGYKARLNDIKNHIKSGYNVGCGCERFNGSGQRTHGKHNTPEYASWIAMKSRCHNPENSSYEWYGGRGIKVCDTWKESFQSFIEDMGLRPGKNYSLDRIDSNKDYYRENCRWSTPKTQARNRRTNSLVTIGGLTKTMAEWQEIFGISRTAFYYRLNKWASAESMLQ